MDRSNKDRPNTIDAAVDEIIAELPLDACVSTANLKEDELRVLELTLGKFIQHKLDQLGVGVNEALREDCIARPGEESMDDADSATVILR